MNDVVIVGLLSLFGTVIGTFGGIVTSAKVSRERLAVLSETFGNETVTE